MIPMEWELIEVNVVIEGEQVDTFRSCVVPPKGEIVSLAKADYRVRERYWAIDRSQDAHIRTTLRAIIELRKL